MCCSDGCLTIPDCRVVDDFDQSSSSCKNAPPERARLEVLTVSTSGDALSGSARSGTIVLAHAEDAATLRSPAYSTRTAIAPEVKLYRVADSGESGLGVFATSEIARGDIIIVETPLLVYPELLPYHRAPTPARRYPELDDALERMSVEDRTTLYSLSNCQHLEPSSAKGILDTNGLSAGTLSSGGFRYAAVCGDISRVNHSCSPNAAYRFDAASFTFELRAVAPIPAGSQIFISYVDLALPRAQRREALSSYGFTCMCTACNLSGTELALSEARRELIRRADSDFADRDAALERWARDPTMPEDYINRVDKIYMDIFEKEQLYYEPVWEGFAVRLFKASCALEDRKGARRWAGLASALNRAYTGSSRGWDTVAAAPERTEWWGRRRRK
ncbi:SET domain-containing protein [Pilatotrama ljubarskyi]|nr:SET domain-containing protein [Pilatotrama ljubarskyi]